jgi:hypothetical protein
MCLHSRLDDLELDTQAGDLSAELRLVVAKLVQDRPEGVDRKRQVVDLFGDFPEAAEDAQTHWHCCDDPLGHGVVS